MDIEGVTTKGLDVARANLLIDIEGRRAIDFIRSNILKLVKTIVRAIVLGCLHPYIAIVQILIVVKVYFPAIGSSLPRIPDSIAIGVKPLVAAKIQILEIAKVTFPWPFAIQTQIGRSLHPCDGLAKDWI